MANPTYGNNKKEQVEDVLRVLLDLANDNYEKFDDYSVFEKKENEIGYKWEESREKCEINFEATLEKILYLLRHHTKTKDKEYYQGSQKKTENNKIKTKLGEIIKNYLGNFLGVLKDNRTSTKGSNKWNFTLTLLHKDTNQNIEHISKRWDKKKEEKSGKTKNKNSYDNIPPQYKALIENKLKLFSGREFVFQEFNKFIKNYPNGYFTVIGEPGIGKSAIAAKYVLDNQLPCFFNIASQGSNTTEQFVEEICTQLSERYNIGRNQNNLSAVLQNANDKLKQDEKLVIVVDALDEAQINQEQERSGQNILCLPRNLPNNVYFFLTRRPYTSQEKRLRLEPGIGFKDLDLNDQQYRKYNREDIKKYLTKVLENNDEQGNEIIRWIEGKGINQNDFIQQLLEKSQINFMYLRYVIGDIANGAYDDVKLNDLPSGLLEYYRDHWQRMKMNDDSKEIEVRVLLTLVALLTNTNSKKIQVTCNDIAHYIKESEFKVKPVLLKWKQFLLENKEKQDISYSFYHKSFLDFLEEEIIKEGCHGDLYEQIIDEIAVSIYGV